MQFSHKFSRESLTFFFEYFFLTGYTLGACPFKLHLECNKDGGKYYLVKSWIPQKIVSGILTFLASFWLIRELRLYFPGEEDVRNPAIHFRFLAVLLDTFLKIITMKRLWLGQQEINHLVNYVILEENKCPLPVGGHKVTRLTNKYSALGGVLLYTTLALVNFASGSGAMTAFTSEGDHTEWSLTWWWRKMVHVGQVNFFLAEPSTINEVLSSEESQFQEYSSLEVVLGILAAVGYYQRRIWGLYTDLLILVATLTLHNTTKLFARSLRATLNDHQELIQIKEQIEVDPGKNNTNEDKQVVIEVEKKLKWSDILDQYQFLKHLTTLTNRIVATNVTFLVAVVSLYYAINIGQTLLNNGKVAGDNIILKSKMIRSIFYYVEYGMILLVAADVGRQMDTLRDWLSVAENRKQVPLDELCLTINELDKKVVAVRGSHVFPITYSLLANLIGLSMTYYIICVQQKQ